MLLIVSSRDGAPAYGLGHRFKSLVDAKDHVDMIIAWGTVTNIACRPHGRGVKEIDEQFMFPAHVSEFRVHVSFSRSVHKSFR